MVFGNWTAEIAHILHEKKRWSVNIDELLSIRNVATGDIYDIIHHVLLKDDMSEEDSTNFLRAVLFVVGRNDLINFSNTTLDNTLANLEIERRDF